MPVSDKPMAYKEFAAIKSQLVTELQLTPREWLQILGPNLDSTGNPQNLLSTAGAVTEASAASILTYGTAAKIAVQDACPPSFGAPTADSNMNTRRRIAVVQLTEAGGSIAATTIVPALAGYTGHCLVKGVYAPTGTTDAANTWTFAVAAGTLLGPATFTMNLTANRFHWFSEGAAGLPGTAIPLRGTIAADDNKAITISAAALAVVGTSEYYCILEYWYET